MSARQIFYPSMALLLLAACGGGDGVVLPDEGEPAAITVLRGNDQQGRVGEPLNDPLVVQVTDARGRPVAGATVAFEFSSAGAGAAVVPEEKTTDANGEAETRLVLATTIGRQTGQARVVQAGSSGPIQTPFSAMALPEDANTMAAAAGQDQTGHVGLPLNDRLVVEVTDGFGNPVAGVPISWTAVGGGSVGANVVDTDEDGRSRVDRVLGPTVGQQSTVASSEGLAGSPVTFSHTAIAGDASQLVILSGSDQTAEAGTVLPADLVVQLIDGDGNGVPQTAVSWVVATGGGLATPEITTTDSEGRTSSKWTLGGTLGQQRLDAVVSGVGVANFRATATAGAPASLFIRTQPSGSARNGVPLARQPVLQLRDSQGNDAAQGGVQVTATIGSGGGELGGTRQVSTDASGRATFTDLSISGGPGPRTLVFTAPGYAQVTSTEIELEALGTTTTITDDTPDPSVAGTQFTVRFTVASGGGTPNGTVTVTVSGNGPTPSCTGILNNGAGSCELTLNNVGDRTLTATYPGGNGFASSSGTASHRVDPAPSQNHEPFADFNWNCQGLTCNFTDNSRDDEGYETITARHWDFGDGTSVDNQLTLSHTYALPGDYTVVLTVTDNGGLHDDSSDRVNPRTPPAQSLRIREQPSSSATIGEAFNRQPELELRIGNDRLEQAGVTVTASIASGGGTLGGTVTATTDGEGRARFSDLSIGGATGTHTLRFTAEGFGEVISTPIEVRKESSQIQITSFEPNDPIVNQTVRVSFSVTGDGGPPTGNVTVTTGSPGETCSGSVAQAFCDIVFTVPGNDRDVTATYEGDGRFEGDSDREDIDVDPAPPANQAPTANDDAATTDAGTPVTIPVRDNDTDPEGATLAIGNVSDPANGSVINNGDGTITYTPDDGFGGTTDAFTYTASDGSLSDDATVTVTVGPVPPPPASLGLRTLPPTTTAGGQVLQPEPEVELLDASLDPVDVEGVIIHAAIASGEGTLGGTVDQPTDGNGRAKFDDIAITGASGGSSVVLSFTAPGLAQVDTPPILIESD